MTRKTISADQYRKVVAQGLRAPWENHDQYYHAVMERSRFGPFYMQDAIEGYADGTTDSSTYHTDGYAPYFKAEAGAVETTQGWKRSFVGFVSPHAADLYRPGATCFWFTYLLLDGALAVACLFFLPERRKGLPQQRPRDGILVPCEFDILYRHNMFRPEVLRFTCLIPREEGFSIGRLNHARSLNL